MTTTEDPAERLEQFIADYGKATPTQIAEKYGLAKTVVGNGAALLKGLGFDIATTERKPAVAFDEKVAVHLHEKGVPLKQIADHLKVKTVSVSAFLKREGYIRPPVSIEEALKAPEAPENPDGPTAA